MIGAANGATTIFKIDISALRITILSSWEEKMITLRLVMRENIVAFIDVEQPSSWELGSQLFGKHASGKDNLSRDRKILIKEKISAKRRKQ